MLCYLMPSSIRRHHWSSASILRASVTTGAMLYQHLRCTNIPINSQICCFGERKMLMFQILLDGAKPRDAGTT